MRSRFAFFLAWSVSVSALAAPTSTGPTSDAELQLLLDQGYSAFERRDYTEAVRLFERLYARYPGRPGTLEAAKSLGIARIQSGQAAQAIDPLKSYIAAKGLTPEATDARLWLAEAYLVRSRPKEAVFVVEEILLHSSSEDRGQSPSRVRALLLKCRAYLALRKFDLGTQSLASARKILGEIKAKDLPDGEGELRRLWARFRREEMSAKISDCARLPTRRKMQESQALDQLDRRGVCVQEALFLYVETLKTGETDIAEASRSEIARAIRSYEDVCAHPPEPLLGVTPSEKRQYRRELGRMLTERCGRIVSRTIEQARLSRADLPENVRGEIDTLAKAIGLPLVPASPPSTLPADSASRPR